LAPMAVGAMPPVARITPAETASWTKVSIRSNIAGSGGGVGTDSSPRVYPRNRMTCSVSWVGSWCRGRGAVAPRSPLRRTASCCFDTVVQIFSYRAHVATAPATEVQVGERVVRVSNPDRVYFPATGATKLDLVDYYLAVGPGIVNALRERPCMLHRFPKGLSGEKVHQKRVPAGAPPWLETVRVHFPRYGLHAHELAVTELAPV